jgi:hypothetical protein
MIDYISQLAADPNWQLARRPAEKSPEWCSDAQQLRETGDVLVKLVYQDPIPEKLLLAKGLLLDAYARVWSSTTNDHRPETNGGQHHCIHDALLTAWKALESIDIEQRMLNLGETLRPPPPPGQPANDLASASEPLLADVLGTILGVEETRSNGGPPS